MRAETVIFTFTGQLPVTSFAEFAQHRASRLSVDLATLAQDSGAATLQVHGAPDLVDMFEMAMSLGPRDCLVTEVMRRPANDTDRKDST